MKAQFSFLSGTRAGQTDVFADRSITIGRHPECNLRFDAEQDLDVSARHAAVLLQGPFYVLRDLGSTNGTMVNGRRLTDEHVLASGDLLQFGAKGPKLEFTAIPDPPLSAVVSVIKSRAESAAPHPPIPPPAGHAADRPSLDRAQRPRRPATGPGTATRSRIEVYRQATGLRRTTVGLFVLLLGVSGAYFWQNRVGTLALEAQRQALLAQVDTLIREIGSLSEHQELLKGELDLARTSVASLRDQIGTGTPSPEAIADLRRRLELAVRQQRQLSKAATLDARLIVAVNQAAVALVFVHFPNGTTYSASGFGVRSESGGGLVVTNRHVVLDSTGVRADRIGVVFNGSSQNFRAELVEVHPEQDLALIRVGVDGGIPTVQSISRDGIPAVGEPVAMIGFPLGLGIAQGDEWKSLGASSTLTLGTVSRTTTEVVQLDSYGAEGASGSPIFDRGGHVIAVLYGEERASNGRILYAVPARFLGDMLAP